MSNAGAPPRSTAAAAKAPSRRAPLATSTVVPCARAAWRSRIQAASGIRSRASHRSSATIPNPPAATTRSAALSACAAAQRIQSSGGPGEVAAVSVDMVAARASSVPPTSTSAVDSPAEIAAASAARTTAVRPEERGPEISLSAARGQPPPSSASSAASPVARRPRSSLSRSSETRCAEISAAISGSRTSSRARTDTLPRWT